MHAAHLPSFPIQTLADRSVPLVLAYAVPPQCVAVSAEADKCAAGDASGRLLIWHGFGAAVARSGAGESPGDLPCTTVHWHAHPVGALAFSSDGSYLLSGGVESVVVRCCAHGRAYTRNMDTARLCTRSLKPCSC